VENQLADSGCRLTKVRDGNKAVGKIRHNTFDTAILLSTGEQMDLVETILNLRDIKPSMPVIVLLDPDSSDPNAAAQAIIARAIPEVPIFTLSEFQSHLVSAKNKKGTAQVRQTGVRAEIERVCKPSFFLDTDRALKIDRQAAHGEVSLDNREHARARKTSRPG
jgi:DNA-binding NtrC family response regulator